ncbi:hypothetical protein Tsubulata_026413 [Turnera subulata]|uniref:Uncharacterized protein n=1 Tax=Turnera subulata TaxID=218843 RepID=A0A9Q0FA55_9ROSI|nr:hypothetical protein Tsubulata_026413 [Turnera subulata]
MTSRLGKKTNNVEEIIRRSKSRSTHPWRHSGLYNHTPSQHPPRPYQPSLQVLEPHRRLHFHSRQQNQAMAPPPHPENKASLLHHHPRL